MAIDFTTCQKNSLKMFGGANGSKIGIIYEDESYMLKFPGEAKLNKELSYANSAACEHIGCRVFELLGVPSQKTLIGTYTYKGKIKTVVACKDLERDGYVLKDFASLKNTIVDSEHGGFGTELPEILRTIDEQQIMSPVKLKKFFWEMFVIDAFLGNFDRHNGNWGFLINQQTQDIRISPIYDCGSCLFPQIDETTMKLVMSDKAELEHRLYVYPKSAIKLQGQKLGYYDYLKSNQDTDCTTALLDIASRIDLEKLNALVDDLPLITDCAREFYKYILRERKRGIIDKAVIDLQRPKQKSKRKTKDIER